MSEQISDQASPDAGMMLSIDDAIQMALKMIGARQLRHAAEILEHVLKAEPDHVPAMNYLGILRYHLAESDTAIDLFNRAARVDPHHAGVQNNLGNVHVELGNLDAAVTAYRAAMRIDPELADPYSNLASILRTQGNVAEAESLLRRALDLKGKNGFAHHNLAGLLMSTGRSEEAIDHFWKAAALIPNKSMTSPFLALAYWNAGMVTEAIAFVRKWANESPDDPQAEHMRAAFTGEDVPGRASNDYVSVLFDGFASSFDSQLDNLDYRAPQLVGDALARVAGEQSQSLAIVDAGCGTGKCAKYLKPYAATLAGVDLSGGMLEKASRRKLYDDLERAELTEFLLGRAGQFDVVVSADTLCYFGRLEEFVAAAARSLRKGGLLIFTVEALQEPAKDDFVLAFNGRYAHRKGYVTGVLNVAGFSVLECLGERLRMESGRQVAGYVVTAKLSNALQ